MFKLYTAPGTCALASHIALEEDCACRARTVVRTSLACGKALRNVGEDRRRFVKVPRSVTSAAPALRIDRKNAGWSAGRFLKSSRSAA